MLNSTSTGDKENLETDRSVESANQDEKKTSLSTIRKKYMNEMIHDLPGPIKNRIKALKVIQLSCTLIEAQFYKEVHTLENKYHALCEPYFEKRSKIVDGTYIPTEEECLWTLDDALEINNSADDIQREAGGETGQKEISCHSGVPDFWLTIFQNVSLISDYIHEYDEPILKYLQDIKLSNDIEPMGFTLHFHFAPNPYFNNTILSKKYYLKCLPDQEDPFVFEGPSIYKCEGCTIEWNKNKNVTVKLVKKKQRHKSRGSIRTVMKEVPNDSFFNFFSPPKVSDNMLEIDEETQNVLESDFQIGHYLRERIVPRAVLYYTGEILEDEEEVDFDEDEDSDVEDEKSIDSENNKSNYKNCNK